MIVRQRREYYKEIIRSFSIWWSFTTYKVRTTVPVETSFPLIERRCRFARVLENISVSVSYFRLKSFELEDLEPGGGAKLPYTFQI